MLGQFLLEAAIDGRSKGMPNYLARWKTVLREQLASATSPHRGARPDSIEDFAVLVSQAQDLSRRSILNANIFVAFFAGILLLALTMLYICTQEFPETVLHRVPGYLESFLAISHSVKETDQISSWRSND